MSEYWMRSIDFCKVAHLLRLIINSPGRLSASDLNRVAIDSGIFVTSQGKAFGPTSCYRYRSVIEKLGLIEKPKGRFFPNLTGDECHAVLAFEGGTELSSELKALLGTRVVFNKDCYETFWQSFVVRQNPTSLEEFISFGSPIVMNPLIGPKNAKHESCITVKNLADSGAVAVHRGYNAVQAIHFGLRSWGVDHLGFLDEFYQVGHGYHLIPVRTSSPESMASVEEALLEVFNFHGDWAMSGISELFLAGSSKLKMPTGLIGTVLGNWIEAYPNLVSPITVSERMLLSGQSEKMVPLILKGFLRLRTGEHVSHLQVHRNLRERVIASSSEEASIGR